MKPGIRYYSLFIFFIAFLISRPAIIWAQSDSTKIETAEKLSPSLELIGIQKGDNTIDLKASMKTKFKGSTIKLPHLKVKFFAVNDAEEKELGYVITDKVGVAIFNLKADGLIADKEGKVKFKAVFDGNKSMESADADVSFKRARLVLEPVKADSTYSAQLKLVDLSKGTETLVPDVTLGLYVKRSFFPLKIGEGKTDSTGTVSVNIPNNLPGDASGNITLLAKVDENETYGYLETAVPEGWGLAVSNKNMELPKALWSSHPPTWMLITFIVLMTTVWGHYIVIVYELFRLRKEEPTIASD
jgi:hypothetical protein